MVEFSSSMFELVTSLLGGEECEGVVEEEMKRVVKKISECLVYISFYTQDGLSTVIEMMSPSLIDPDK